MSLFDRTDVWCGIGVLAAAIIMSIFIYDTNTFGNGMSKATEQVFAKIDKNTTNPEVISIIKTECGDVFEDSWFNYRTQCIKTLQNKFIISARD